MSWADRIRRLRDRIDPPQEVDPDDFAVLAIVAFHEGPLLVSALELVGVTAQMDEVSFLAGRLPAKARVAVRNRDMAAAVEVLRDLGPSTFGR